MTNTNPVPMASADAAIPVKEYYVGQDLLDLVQAFENNKTLVSTMASQMHLQALRHLDIVGFPTTLALPFSKLREAPKEPVAQISNLKITNASQSQEYHTVMDYHNAYLNGVTTPTEVAEKLLAAIEDSHKHEWMQPVVDDDVLAQAAASTERYKAGKPLSPFDGVFTAFKEDQAIKGRVSNGGTTYINKDKPATEDGTAIARLRAAGAIIVGHTRMQQIGWDVWTCNPHSGTPRNPYKLSASSGGSSGGSAAVVAGGLMPLTLGGDGGGSVRIPAGFCGAYGLKPTCGRVSGFGGMGFGASVGVIGPIGASADDMTLALSVIAGADPKDEKTSFQPAMDFSDYNKTDSLEGVTIGVVNGWFDECVDKEMIPHLKKVQQHLEKLGATIVNIDLKDVMMYRAAHAITISSEMNSFIRRFREHHNDNLSVNRIFMALVNECTPTDYIKSQVLRTQAMKQMEEVFSKVDLLYTPTTAILALDFPEGAYEHGMLWGERTGNCTQFLALANFTGIPGVAVPVGFHEEKPVSAHFLASWYNEPLLCRMAKVCELMPDIERRRAPNSYHANFLPNKA